MFDNWRLIKRLFPYMRPYKWRAILLVFVTLISALFALATPWPLAFLLDNVLAEDRQAYPGLLGFLDGWGVSGQIAFVVILGFTFVLINDGINVLQRAIDARLELGMVLDFRSDLFRHVQRLSFQYHDREAAGRFIYQINMIAHDAGSIPTSMLPLAEALLTVVGMFIVTYLIAPSIAIAAAIVIPIAYLTTVQYGKRVEPTLLRARDQEGESMSIIHEKLSIIRVVVSFCREHYEHARFREQGERALNTRVRVTIMQTVFALGITLITAAGTAIVLLMGAHHVINERIQVGELTVILAYVAAVYRPIEQIAHSLAHLQFQLIQMRIVFSVFDEVPEVQERANPVTLPAGAGRIEFQGVSFHYNSRERTIEDVSFAIEPGEFVAIVGPTGAGKSTLVSLLPRFFDPQSGRVLIDGRDLKDLSLDSLRQSISIVMQEPILFSGTIADNIRYGRLEATDEEIVAAAKAANCHDFISALPDGYESTLGERGARISGGERQRIAVARAFLKDAPIIILDEPTSAIDSKTEGVILEALERLAAGRTTIMIAHRLSTIRNADRILVMNDGRLVEQGTHRELLARDGMYKGLWNAQFGSSDPPPASLPSGTPSGGPPALPAASASLDRAESRGSIDSPVIAAPAMTGAILRGRPKVVVLGMMTKIPVAGVVWQTMHYLVGLERLGVQAYYVEAHARTPSMFMERESDDGSTKAATFIAETMRRFGFDGRWAFHALHDDGAVHGMTKSELMRLYAEADVIINLHGGTEPLPEHAATGRLVYLETDPVQLQIELHENDPTTIAFLESHVAFFTFGENYGKPDCGLPVSDRFRFLPTRQPVVLDFWEDHGTGPARSFTTIGNWRQSWREVRYQGQTYQWSKHLEFAKFLDLPRLTEQDFELALSSYGADDKHMLEARGWRIAHALDFSIDLDTYRSYVAGSRGEFTVAKDQNVRLRTGWFSDRSATYLAAGRPVITQDTGFGNVLPTGEGLFAFQTIDDAVAAVARIGGDYERHRRAAHAIAREHFAHDVVLRPLLAEVGVQAAQRPAAIPASAVGGALPFPSDLDLTVVRRKPTTLSAETVNRVLAHPLPSAADRATQPTVSIIVPVHDNLVFTRLCLESVLSSTSRADIEIVVIDNGSAGVTAAYLTDLAQHCARVVVVRNTHNIGFAPAINQGVRTARGDVIVLLNNDTIVSRGWLGCLERVLADPTVGAVGPVTNSAPNEARIDVSYTTYEEFDSCAAARSALHGDDVFEVPMLTMFCVAMRREVFDRVGPLDEQFEVGMFEDDDYAIRLRNAGLRSICAEGVHVHHFGEATLGALVANGEYGRVFEANRHRFEMKWGRAWSAHHGRPDPAYDSTVDRIRAAIERVVPAGSVVLVVSKGDDSLLDVPGRTLWHFPRAHDGGYSGWYPGSSVELLELLDQQLMLGASHIVFPDHASWWLEFYEGLAERVVRDFSEVGGDGCRIFAVRQAARLETGVDVC